MTAVTTAPATSPAEYVLALSVEEQEAVFLALLEKVLEVNKGDGKILLRTPDGRSLGYLTPPEVEKEQTEVFFASMTPMERGWLANPIGPVDWNDRLTQEELDAITRGGYRPEGSAPLEPIPPKNQPAVPPREIAR
jgi:hypothetical protein